jgi:hydroxyacylglutathione hydrolase
MLSSFAGWLFDPDDRLVLVADSSSQASEAACHLARIGYDSVVGYLAPSLTNWASGARPFSCMSVVGVDDVVGLIDRGTPKTKLLDVRAKDEVAAGTIEGAQHIYLGDLPRRIGELDRGKRYVVFCDSGVRAAIGASYLEREGFHNVDLFFGSIQAWISSGFKTVPPDQ